MLPYSDKTQTLHNNTSIHLIITSNSDKISIPKNITLGTFVEINGNGYSINEIAFNTCKHGTIYTNPVKLITAQSQINNLDENTLLLNP